MRLPYSAIVFASLVAGGATAAEAQMGPGGPPAVGVTKAAETPIYQSSEYVGRIQAVSKVTVRARVTGLLEERDFKEGDEVKQGQQLFIIEQPPYQAAVLQAQGAVIQAEASLKNAKQNLNRSSTLLNTPAGQRSTVDTDTASQGQSQGQLLVAEAQLQTAQINLGYTTIRSPIDGRIGISTDPGNVVAFTDSPLVTVVSEDPEYVLFPVSEVDAMKLIAQGKGGLDQMSVKLRLPNGQTYDQTGKIDFSDISVSSSTDTIDLRASIPNPARGAATDAGGNRTLVDGGFVTVILQSKNPVQSITIPRAAVLADQQGFYVFVIGDKNVAARRNITMGQSPDPLLAVIASGLKVGDQVVADGVQRVHPGAPVKPVPYQAPVMPPSANGDGSDD
ncbi:efflux RND transporter periplasmic adaptor subunit [Acidisoma cellulosilytica]|uniref:Efflux RND transporter periplasmic adaptor subunit n=1 Tax=Acidisoma cellulosilyticum TaxID=2802395 RepID=A0A963YYZ5_9PROT|nr:efflux RND transporter periplasmic adaptor subunit [Acidisoma cellulosilyticum]MCB8879640.1 efflux RND transporter periplasmic adaptor subunit [Acidisoma cellulosilyticum]